MDTILHRCTFISNQLSLKNLKNKEEKVKTFKEIFFPMIEFLESNNVQKIMIMNLKFTYIFLGLVCAKKY